MHLSALPGLSRLILSRVTLSRTTLSRTTGRVLLLLCAMYFLLYVDRVNIATAATTIQRDLGLTNVQLGLAFSAFAYPYAFFQVFGGWIGDRFGARRTLAICGTLVAAATVLTGLAGGLVGLFLARLALGFGEGACFPTATRAMASWTPAAAWGYAQGVTHSAARLGNAATPPLISALILWLSWRASFFVLGVVSLAWVLTWAWYFRDDPQQHPGITRHEIETLAATAGAAASAPVPWRRLVRRVLPVTLVDFCYGWGLWMFLNWIPALFQSAYGLDLKRSALFSSAVFLAGVVGDVLGGVVSDQVLRRTASLRAARGGVIAAGLFGAFVFLLPLFVSQDLTVVAVSLGLAFFCLELVVAPIWAVPMDIAPEHAGKASGLMNLGFGVAGIVSPVAIGAVIDLTGSRTLPFAGSAALLLVGAALALRLRPDLGLDSGQIAT